MNYLKILNKNEKAQVLKKLRDQFGVKELNGILVQRGAERIFLYQGSLNDKEIKELEHTVPTERVGIYFAKIEREEIRLSIDGANLLKNQITKNSFELNKKDVNLWLHGNEINPETNLKGFVIVKYKDDFLGTGRASTQKITNFLPKSRRLKIKN